MKRAGTYEGGGEKKSRGGGGGGGNDEPDYEEEYDLMEGVVFEKIEGEPDADSSDAQESRWSRPPMREGFDPKVHSLEFHWLDIDTVNGDPLLTNPAGGAVLGASEGPVPIIRLYGVTQDGQSVMAHVHGFTPYFYVSFGGTTQLTDALLTQLRINLDARVSYLHFTGSFSILLFMTEISHHILS